MNLVTKLSGSVLVVLGLSSAGLYAQQKHGDHSAGNHGAMAEKALPTEPGQSGFAAIAEIVEMLNQDASTDWSSINISALREHLVDMNELTLRSTVKAEYGESEAQFFVTGEGRTLTAIQNMVPAHAKELTKFDGWSVTGTRSDGGAVLQINAVTPEDMVKIKGLGFYGLMATGAHHQAHHFAMATGDMHAH